MGWISNAERRTVDQPRNAQNTRNLEETKTRHRPDERERQTELGTDQPVIHLRNPFRVFSAFRG